MNIFKHLIFITILFITACDPAQEISANFVLPTCPVGERYFEFTNIAPITFTLPPAPEVGCSITYAMYKNTVTFNGALLTIKGDGLSVATSLVRTTTSTGRLVWNGLHWVHIGGA